MPACYRVLEMHGRTNCRLPMAGHTPSPRSPTRSPQLNSKCALESRIRTCTASPRGHAATETRNARSLDASTPAARPLATSRNLYGITRDALPCSCHLGVATQRTSAGGSGRYRRSQVAQLIRRGSVGTVSRNPSHRWREQPESNSAPRKPSPVIAPRPIRLT